MRVSMGVSYGIENFLAALEVRAEAVKELNHGRVVGNEKLAAVNRKREVAIADFESDANGVGRAGGRDGEDGFRGGLDF